MLLQFAIAHGIPQRFISTSQHRKGRVLGFYFLPCHLGASKALLEWHRPGCTPHAIPATARWARRDRKRDTWLLHGTTVPECKDGGVHGVYICVTAAWYSARLSTSGCLVSLLGPALCSSCIWKVEFNTYCDLPLSCL
jgi:hypothetical protein